MWLNRNGTPQAYATTGSQQGVYLTFSANAGDNFELTLTGINVVGGGGYNTASVNVYNGSGTNIASSLCDVSNPGGSCSLPLWNLVAGTSLGGGKRRITPAR